MCVCVYHFACFFFVGMLRLLSVLITNYCQSLLIAIISIFIAGIARLSYGQCLRAVSVLYRFLRHRARVPSRIAYCERLSEGLPAAEFCSTQFVLLIDFGPWQDCRFYKDGHHWPRQAMCQSLDWRLLLHVGSAPPMP